MIYNLFRKYRHVAYRQFVRWCWGYLGKNVRVVLPSCAVKAVQDAFQSNVYRGFQLPVLER